MTFSWSSEYPTKKLALKCVKTSVTNYFIRRWYQTSDWKFTFVTCSKNSVAGRGSQLIFFVCDFIKQIASFRWAKPEWFASGCHVTIFFTFPLSFSQSSLQKVTFIFQKPIKFIIDVHCAKQKISIYSYLLRIKPTLRNNSTMFQILIFSLPPGEQGPPQSMPLSPWFWIPSKHVAI